MARCTKAKAEQTRQEIIAAARRVFRGHGVARSTLDQIAREAGVTRGAVYWHFQNKQEIFFAMREQVLLPLVDQTDEGLVDENLEDPLAGIETALLRMFTLLEDDAAARETFQIMIFCCEYVGEFAPVLTRNNASYDNLCAKLERAYRRAAERGRLRAGLEPALLARDTMAFLTGTIDRWLEEPGRQVVGDSIKALLAQHLSLRRA